MRRALLFIILFAAFSAFAQRTNTKRGELVSKAEITALENLTSVDTLAYSDKIIFSGYSKTVSDRDESFYITNNTPFRLSKLSVLMNYSTPEGELLHRQDYEIVCDIPSGETRQVAVKSFDTQHSHYYYKSRKPRRSAVSFQVTYTLLGYDVAVRLR